MGSGVESGPRGRHGRPRKDPLKVALAGELQATMLAASEAAGAAAIRKHEPVLVSEVDEAALRAFGFDEREIEIAHALEPRSYVTVPLIARNEVFGSISLVTAESGRLYLIIAPSSFGGGSKGEYEVKVKLGK